MSLHHSEPMAKFSQNACFALYLFPATNQGSMMTSKTNVSITVQLTQSEAQLMARYFRNTGFQDYRSCASSEDEAYRMIDTNEKLRQVLSLAGYSGD